MKSPIHFIKTITTVFIVVPTIYLFSIAILLVLGNMVPVLHACHLNHPLSFPGMAILTEMTALLAAAFFS